MGRAIVSDEVELEVRRMCEELQRRALTGAVVWGQAKPGVQALIEGRVSVASSAALQPGTPPGTKKRDLVEERRKQFEDWYHSLGFAITVLKPNLSNRAIAKRRAKGQDLFFRPATSEVSYEAFMAAVGQGNHWTVTNAAERTKIGWEATAAGYWFWADVQDNCPRLRTSWNTFSSQIQLFSLEEYVIVWHATKAMADRMLDVRTWCWLRTRFGPGALNASGYDGCVYVHRDSAGSLSFSYGNEGGRALDVVK